ncbi:MAG TPA: hypothetical protein PKL31_02245 [Fulvivirga sp.]|nr:hypothetical protein [Fulvivirga sp.]
MAYYSTEIHKYSYIWNKYRPAILRLMVDSQKDPQEYQFSKHEFHNINPKEKGGYAFNMRVFQGKATNDIRTSTLAKDLLVILQQSKRALEMIDEAPYEFTLDKHFMLHIKQEDPIIEEPGTDEKLDDETSTEN